MQKLCFLIQDDVRISKTRELWTDKQSWPGYGSSLIFLFTICLFKQLLSTNPARAKQKWFQHSSFHYPCCHYFRRNVQTVSLNLREAPKQRCGMFSVDCQLSFFSPARFGTLARSEHTIYSRVKCVSETLPLPP